MHIFVASLGVLLRFVRWHVMCDAICVIYSKLGQLQVKTSLKSITPDIFRLNR